MNPDRRPRGGNFHNERVTEVIAHEAATFIAREAGSNPLITVVRAMPMQHGDRYVVFVSIFPEEQTRTALAFLERRREAFSSHLKTHARLGPLPRIDFQVDNGDAMAEVPKS